MTKSSKARVTKRVGAKRAPKNSGLLAGVMTKEDHEQLIRVYGFYWAISGAMEGNPDLLGRAKGVAQATLDDLCIRYSALYGEAATEALLQHFADEFHAKEKTDEKEDSRAEGSPA